MPARNECPTGGQVRQEARQVVSLRTQRCDPKDNRIPPEGFSNSAFAEHLCAPVGAVYADGQHWDELDLELPSGTSRVLVRLMHQSVSWEYIKFLAEENRTDSWGKRLHEAWTKTEYCPPEVMAEEFDDSSIDFEVHYWHAPEILEGLRVRDEVTRAVDRALKETGIVIAFPQRTLWWGNDQSPAHDDGPGQGSAPE